MKRVLLISVTLLIALGVGTVYSQQPEIPSWVKITADLWANDKTSDEEFVNALEFLINAGVIQVGNTVSLDDYDSLRDNYNRMLNDRNALRDGYATLRDDYSALRDDYSTLYDDYNAVVDYYDDRYPLTTISGTQVNWKFYDSKENYYTCPCR